MARDVMKSFGEEPGTGKLYAVCVVLAVIAHFLPWRLTTALGMLLEKTDMGFKIGALGVISGTALIAAMAGFAHSLLAELTQAGRRKLTLLLVALTAVAAVLQLVFFFRTGGAQQTPIRGFTLASPESAAWGFYIALLATLAAVVLGVLRMKSLPSAAPEAPAPAPPSAPPANPQ